MIYKLLIFIKLSKSRYKHSVRTANTAKQIATIFGVNKRLTYKASLLHDIAKNMSENQLKKYIKKYNIELTDYEKNNLNVVHGKVGKDLLRNRYFVFNKSILNAVENHTIGHQDMDDVSKVVFIADFIEPGRKFITEDFKRNLLNQNDINSAVILVYELTFQFFNDCGKLYSEESFQSYKGFLNAKG